jgi:hypothetical protein
MNYCQGVVISPCAPYEVHNVPISGSLTLVLLGIVLMKWVKR